MKIKDGIWIAAVATLAALTLPAAAGANPAYEPNDGIHQAYGPLRAATNYDATISSHEDSDWYIAYASGPGVLDIDLTTTFTGTCTGCASVELRLLDGDGGDLNSVDAGQGETQRVSYTVPGAGFYYLVADGSAGYEYRLRLSGSLTDGPRPGPGEATPNASHTMATAYGPLTGGTLYEASLDSYDEEDWFKFHTAGPGEFDVALTTTFTGTCRGCASVDMDLYDAAGESLASTAAGVNERGHVRYTADGPRTFYLQLEDGPAGSKYQLQVTPSSLISATAPPVTPPGGGSPDCAAAQSKLAKAKAKLAAAKAKGASKKRLKKLKGKVRAAKRQVAAAC